MKVPRIRRRWVVPVLLMGVTAGAVGAGAAAAFEADTVGSYWEGLWWSLSLMTTVGFLDGPPKSLEGAIASAVLMIVGFLMLSLVSATMASLLVREDEEPFEQQELSHADEVLAALADISSRLHVLEVAIQSRAQVTARPDDMADTPTRPSTDPQTRGDPGTDIRPPEERNGYGGGVDGDGSCAGR